MIETNEAAQTHGVLDVTYFSGNPNVLTLFETIKMAAPIFLTALPLRLCTVHFCWNQQLLPTSNNDKSEENFKNTETGISGGSVGPHLQRIWEYITEFVIQQFNSHLRV